MTYFNADTLMNDKYTYNLNTTEKCVLYKILLTAENQIVDRDLTERQKEVYILFKKGHNQAEIASILRLSQPTICRHICSINRIIDDRIRYAFYGARAVMDSELL